MAKAKASGAPAKAPAEASGKPSVLSPGPLTLLTQAWKKMRPVSGRLLFVIVAAQLVITLVAAPLIGFVFREALRANGMVVLDTDTFAFHWGFGFTIALLLLMLLIVMWLVVLEFSAMVILLRNPQYTAGDVLSDLARVIRKALHPNSWFMIVYLVLILPLSGFGFVSGLLRGVQVPNFITGELEKEPLYATLLTIAYAVVAYINVRLGLTLPYFALTTLSGNGSLKESWRVTRGLRPWSIVVAVIILIAAVSLAFAALFYILLAPTALADTVAPKAAWVTAAIGLGIGHIAALLLLGYTVAFIAGILIAYGEAHEGLPVTGLVQKKDSKGRVPRTLAIVTIVLGVVAASVLSLPALRNVASAPTTAVLAHRGWTEKGVENSIEALEAAAALHPDFVEFDTMRTADGQYVVIHDPDLARLAGEKKQVKDMTLDELTATEIHDELGHTATIPSLVEYASKAKELGQPLLIEVKISGAEPSTEQNVADIIAVLRENDLLEGNLFHSLDHDTAQEIKRQLPDATVGYIMPFAAIGAPDTLADFLVLEESSATPAMRKHARDAGLGYAVWTVEDEDAMRFRFREGADAIITDHPDVALELRDKMAEQTGLAGRLHDMMLRFMKPF